MGASSGSRASTEPVPVSALSGFDPGDISVALAMQMFNALYEIEQFGYANPGHGFSCARKASVALGRKPR